MIRNTFSLLILAFAGLSCAQAQTPIVKINASTSECDVTAQAGDPIFTFDAQGNVLINGTMSGPGCGGSGGGGTGTVSFSPFNPSPAPLALSPNSFTAGSGSSVLTYAAAYATGCSVSSSVGTVSGTGGTCPSLSISNASCTGTGSPVVCSVGNGSVSEPTTLASGITSCAYSLTATCNPGGVTSSATLTVLPSDSSPPPAGCQNLVQVGTGGSGYWSKVGTTSVRFGDGTVKSGVDATSYVDVWSYPGTTVAWPGNAGLTTRPSAAINQYFAEKFTVPTDGSVSGHPNWAFSGSGINSNMSLTISSCPGDFGQTGSVLTTGCKIDMSGSSSGLTAVVSASQVSAYCSLAPGGTYYLNILPMAHLPTSNVSTSSCSGTCTPWLGRN